MRVYLQEPGSPTMTPLPGPGDLVVAAPGGTLYVEPEPDDVGARTDARVPWAAAVGMYALQGGTVRPL